MHLVMRVLCVMNKNVRGSLHCVVSLPYMLRMSYADEQLKWCSNVDRTGWLRAEVTSWGPAACAARMGQIGFKVCSRQNGRVQERQGSCTEPVM